MPVLNWYPSSQTYLNMSVCKYKSARNWLTTISSPSGISSSAGHSMWIIKLNKILSYIMSIKIILFLTLFTYVYINLKVLKICKIKVMIIKKLFKQVGRVEFQSPSSLHLIAESCGSSIIYPSSHDMYKTKSVT